MVPLTLTKWFIPAVGLENEGSESSLGTRRPPGGSLKFTGKAEHWVHLGLKRAKLSVFDNSS